MALKPCRVNASIRVDSTQPPGLLIVNGEFTSFHSVRLWTCGCTLASKTRFAGPIRPHRDVWCVICAHWMFDRHTSCDAVPNQVYVSSSNTGPVVFNSCSLCVSHACSVIMAHVHSSPCIAAGARPMPWPICTAPAPPPSQAASLSSGTTFTTTARQPSTPIRAT